MCASINIKVIKKEIKKASNLKSYLKYIKDVAKKYAEDLVDYYNNVRPQGRTSMTPIQLRNLAA